MTRTRNRWSPKVVKLEVSVDEAGVAVTSNGEAVDLNDFRQKHHGVRWGGVTRKSRVRKGQPKPFSVENQERAIKAHVAHVGGEYIKTYTDIKSGYRKGVVRDQYEQALTDLQAGAITGIIVWKLDRLTRRMAEFGRFWSLCEKHGGVLTAVEDPVDTSSTLGLIIVNLLVGFAQMEAESIGVRTQMGHARTARDGRAHRTAIRPFGHSRDWTQIVPEEAELIREACSRIRDEGHRVTTICKDWEQRTPPVYTTWNEPVDPITGEETQSKTRERHGDRRNHFTARSLTEMLISPRLVGRRPYMPADADELVSYGDGDIKAILKVEEWEAMQRILHDRHKPRKGRLPRRLLTGIGKCGRCGKSTITSTTNARQVAMYCCKKAPNYPGCGRLSMVAKPLEHNIKGEVIAAFSQPAFIAALSQMQAPNVDTRALNHRLIELEGRQEQLDKDHYNPAKGRRPMSKRRYDLLSADIGGEMDEIQRQLDATQAPAVLSDVLRNRRRIAERWEADEAKGGPWRRMVLELVVEHLVILPAGKQPGFGRPFDPSRVDLKLLGLPGTLERRGARAS